MIRIHHTNRGVRCVLTLLYYRKFRNNYHLALFLSNTLSYGILLSLFAYWTLYTTS
jgi:hypothetical protein